MKTEAQVFTNTTTTATTTENPPEAPAKRNGRTAKPPAPKEQKVNLYEIHLATLIVPVRGVEGSSLVLHRFSEEAMRQIEAKP